MQRVDKSGNSMGSTNLIDIIFRPAEAFNVASGGLDSIMLGLISEPASKFDSKFADTIQNRLFEVKLSDGSVIAIDLAATNINRGRDHGIATYNTFREKCGLRKASTFADLQDTISAENIAILQSVYE
jgi:peroxidase